MSEISKEGAARVVLREWVFELGSPQAADLHAQFEVADNAVDAVMHLTGLGTAAFSRMKQDDFAKDAFVATRILVNEKRRIVKDMARRLAEYEDEGGEFYKGTKT